MDGGICLARGTVAEAVVVAEQQQPGVEAVAQQLQELLGRQPPEFICEVEGDDLHSGLFQQYLPLVEALQQSWCPLGSHQRQRVRGEGYDGRVEAALPGQAHQLVEHQPVPAVHSVEIAYRYGPAAHSATLSLSASSMIASMSCSGVTRTACRPTDRAACTLAGASSR